MDAIQGFCVERLKWQQKKTSDLLDRCEDNYLPISVCRVPTDGRRRRVPNKALWAGNKTHSSVGQQGRQAHRNKVNMWKNKKDFLGSFIVRGKVILHFICGIACNDGLGKVRVRGKWLWARHYLESEDNFISVSFRSLKNMVYTYVQCPHEIFFEYSFHLISHYLGTNSEQLWEQSKY